MPQYYVHDERFNIHVFTVRDPRLDGYEGRVVENAEFFTTEDVALWRDGEPRPNPVLAVSAVKPTSFREFASTPEAVAAGYQLVTGTWMVSRTWKEYLELVERNR